MKTIFQAIRQRLTRIGRAMFAEAPGSKPAVPDRKGWTPLPDAPQLRRRKTDARPWAQVRPSGSAAPGVHNRTPLKIP